MAEITKRIADSMILLDPENEAIYRANLQKASEMLETLSSEIKTVVSGLSGKKVIVMNEALIYTTQEYGLSIDLCYERESGEDLYDADLVECLQALRKSDADVILIEKQAPQRLCNALKDAGYQLACMDVLSTRRAQEDSQAYFDALRSNAHAAKEAFAAAESLSEAHIAGGNS